MVKVVYQMVHVDFNWKENYCWQAYEVIVLGPHIHWFTFMEGISLVCHLHVQNQH